MGSKPDSAWACAALSTQRIPENFMNMDWNGTISPGPGLVGAATSAAPTESATNTRYRITGGNH